MDLLGYPSELIIVFAVIGIVVVFVASQVLVGFLQAIGTDIWEELKKRK